MGLRPTRWCEVTIPVAPRSRFVAADFWGAVKAEIMKGGYSVIKGPLNDNTGKEVVAAGTAYQETAIELESMGYLVEGVIGSTS